MTTPPDPSLATATSPIFAVSDPMVTSSSTSGWAVSFITAMKALAAITESRMVPYPRTWPLIRALGRALMRQEDQPWQTIAPTADRRIALGST